MPIWNGNIYGEQFTDKLRSLKANYHRQPSNIAGEWDTITNFSLRFYSGRSCSGTTVNGILNIHEGDTFTVYEYNNKITFLRNEVTGIIYINSPFYTEENKKRSG